MSTLDRPDRRPCPRWSPASGSTAHVPRALRGDAAGDRAELVGGVVYMPSPLGYEHGGTTTDCSRDWLRPLPERFDYGGQSNAHDVVDDGCTNVRPSSIDDERETRERPTSCGP